MVFSLSQEVINPLLRPGNILIACGKSANMNQDVPYVGSCLPTRKVIKELMAELMTRAK
jgi:hypothetical protein